LTSEVLPKIEEDGIFPKKIEPAYLLFLRFKQKIFGQIGSLDTKSALKWPGDCFIVQFLYKKVFYAAEASNE
jgi:hypothetical protein